MKVFLKTFLAAFLVGCLFLQTILSSTTFAASAKRVEINKTNQVLITFEDNRVVMISRVSTGRWDASTPNGIYKAGKKSRMHYSRKYHNAPMPYSVHVTGNVFIHGYTYVPPWPDSHGCIRLPLDGSNPAKQFYDWVDSETEIKIYGKWLGSKN